MPVDSGSLSLVLFSFLVSGLAVVTVGAAATAWRTENPRLERVGWVLARRAGTLLGGIGLFVAGVVAFCVAVSWRVLDVVWVLELFAPPTALYVLVLVERGVRGLVCG
ncbi:hypothetical protein SAMN04487950_2388 [Halogranum rubrum]|uniref:Uncharacterized protein n=1 Tax=Halogranum rubrum TaxID=553466 RepID=A0A1I4EWP8_9EURY|nr:hypothetical protein [Halogranum rubrum]SFL08966.1 hypothetical protein SAMN04487950_2388 [Halogranum rubrum]